MRCRPDCVICKNVSLEMSRRINEVAVRIMDPSDLFGNGMFQLLLFSTLFVFAKTSLKTQFSLTHTYTAFPANICLRACEVVFFARTYIHTHLRLTLNTSAYASFIFLSIRSSRSLHCVNSYI